MLLRGARIVNSLEAVVLGFKAVHYSRVSVDQVEEAGAEGLNVRWLITKDDGANNFAMRFFEVARGGHTPRHSHNWEHEVYVLEGKGEIRSEEGSFPIEEGDVIFIASREKHQLNNDSSEVLKFLCMIPKIPEKD